MNNETKTPKAGEWWRSDSGLIAFIVGLDPYGDPVWMQKGHRVPLTDQMKYFLSCFYHEPRCTGFDWVDPPAETVHTIDVDPGDGYRWLEDDEIVTPTDDVFRPDLSPCWVKPLTRAGKTVKHFDSDDYPVRRSIARTQPVESPAIDPGEGWELLPVGTRIRKGDQCLCDDGKTWTDSWRWRFDESVGGPNTESTYRRKIKPEVWPKWYVHSDADRDWCVERFKEDRCRVHRVSGVKEDQSWIEMYNVHIADGTWIDVDKSEAIARVTPPEPEFCVSCGVHSVVPGTQECGPCIQRAIDDARCPVESPDDWVEISKILHPDHIPRPDIDVLLGVYIENNDAEDRSTVRSGCSPIAHNTWDDLKFVCRRKDLPASVPAVKRLPVRLWCLSGDKPDAWGSNIIVSPVQPAIFDDQPFQEILHDADGWYVEVTE